MMRQFLLFLLLCTTELLAAQVQYSHKFGTFNGTGFGHSTDVFENVMVVGRVKTEYNDPFNHSKGDAFIYRRQALTRAWLNPVQVKAFDAVKADEFGCAVATNGSVVAIAARFQDKNETGGLGQIDGGAVYLFRLDTTTQNWVMFQKIVAADAGASDKFGTSLSLRGNLLAVGAIGHDFDATGDNPITNAGAVYVFEPNTAGFWLQTAKITPNEREADADFGRSVSTDGQRIIAGAPDQDYNGEVRVGAAYIFERSGTGTWQQATQILSDKPIKYARFGSGVGISGDWAVVDNETDTLRYDNGAASQSKSTYVMLHRSAAGFWTKHHNLEAPFSWIGVVDSSFGTRVMLHGNLMVVGNELGRMPDVAGVWKISAGRADVFRLDSVSMRWRHLTTLKKPNAQEADEYAQAIATDGQHVVVGCAGDNTNALGQTSSTDIGSAFMYGFCVPVLQNRIEVGCFSVNIDNQVFTQDTILQNAAAPNCDSVVYVNVDVVYPAFSIQNTPLGLAVPDIGNFTYQWLNCSNGSITPITAATDSVYWPSQSGMYAVEVTDWLFGCSVVLPCVPWTSSTSSPADLPDQNVAIHAWPCPFTDVLHVELQDKRYKHYTLHDAYGSRVHSGACAGTTSDMDTSSLPAGMYWLTVQGHTEVMRRLVVKVE